MRHCKYCGRDSTETEFYALTYGTCKTCHCQVTMKNYWKNRETRIARTMVYNKTHPIAREKKIAHQLLWHHVNAGHIKKPTECEKCGKTDKLDGHHADHAKKLEVVWLCRKCHASITFAA